MTAEDLKRVLIELGHEQAPEGKLGSCYEEEDTTIEFSDVKEVLWMETSCPWWEEAVCYRKPEDKSIEEWLLDLFFDFQLFATVNHIDAWGDLPKDVAKELKRIILKIMEERE